MDNDPSEKLTESELKILAFMYVNPDANVPKIARDLGYSISTVRSYRTSIYKKLGITGDDTEKEKLAREWYSKWQMQGNTAPISSGDVTGGVFPERPQEEILQPPVIISPPPDPRRTNNLIPIIFIVIIFSVVFLALGVFIGSRINQSETPPTLAVSNLPTSVIPTTLPTPIEVSTPTWTSMPTETFTPTQFPTTTPTEAFVPPDDGILFFDNFDNGLSPEWMVNEGKYTVVGGTLGSLSNEVFMITGDPRWQNYRVSFDIYDNRGSGIKVGVHMQDYDHGYYLWINRRYAMWYLASPDRGGYMYETRVRSSASLYGPVEILVSNNQLSANVAGTTVPTVIDSNYQQGKVALTLTYQYISLDNFLIEWLP